MRGRQPSSAVWCSGGSQPSLPLDERLEHQGGHAGFEAFLVRHGGGTERPGGQNRQQQPCGRLRVQVGPDVAVGLAALTMAEYFRDVQGQDVLLFIDNIFRFIQAGSEVSGLMGQLPSRLGYQPTLGTELANLEERICNTASGAITSVQAVYVPADDFADPSGDRNGRGRRADLCRDTDCRSAESNSDAATRSDDGTDAHAGSCAVARTGIEWDEDRLFAWPARPVSDL